VYNVPKAMQRPVSRKNPASASNNGRDVLVFMDVE
jgi:hypothetical protein